MTDKTTQAEVTQAERELADILSATDPEGADEEWSYVPQARAMFAHPRFARLSQPPTASTSDVREALEPVIHWYQSDEHPERPLAEIVADVVADLQQDRAWVLNPPKHKFWMPGEPDCPREIKAGNGELHTFRCKVCGQDSPRDPFCRNALSAQPAPVMVEALSHEEAIKALSDCAATVTVLSYAEVVDGYFKLRGITVP